MASGIRWTTEEFIEQCHAVHGDRYDYSLVEYINNKTKVQIICKTHGLFEQLAQHHMRGRGCTQCGNEYNSERQRSNTQEFIKKATAIHGSKYDYSLVDYVTNYKKVTLICNEHGQFPQTPSDHLSGCGCPKCYLKKSSESKTKSTSEFINRASEVHKGKYDYSLVDYKKSSIKVIIICPYHGEFTQIPAEHLYGKGCHKCGGTQKLTRDEFIERAKETHGDTYDYSRVNYSNGATKVEIICLKHGSFWQFARDHLTGHGCQHCSSSIGEQRISNVLSQWGIRFTRQKKFNGCKGKRRVLPFDFYFQIGKHHILLEFDGGQHFQPVKHFGGIDHFEKTKRNDATKTQFAQSNGLILIRIPYSQLGSIEMVLQDEIEKHIGQLIEAIINKQQRKTKATLFNPTRYKQVPLL